MQRPGPLQELPLERFLPSNPNFQPTPVKLIRSNKRPLSPSGPSPFSPAKRRILNDEGIYSPEKTSKSSITSSVAQSLGSPARFSRVLASSTSPARVLDFGLPKDVYGDPQKVPSSGTLSDQSTPAQISSSSKHLAPSPELKVRKARPSHHSLSSDRSGFDGNGNNEGIHGTCSFSSMNHLQFVPRELPPQCDPQSIHYPGFSVYQDPYLTVFQTLDEDLASVSDIETDSRKENLPPQRKSHKVALDSKAEQDLFSLPPTTPRNVQSTNQTPTRMEPWGSAELSSTIARNMFRISSPLATSRQGRKSTLQMMKDEMDAVNASDGYDSSDE